MKIAVDKQFTPVEMREQVNNDLKFFKAMYSDADLLRAFIDATDVRSPVNTQILSCEVEGFPGGTDFNNETRFQVSLVTKGFKKFFEIRYYCGMRLDVDTNDLMYHPGKKMYSCEVYERSKKLC